LPHFGLVAHGSLFAVADDGSFVEFGVFQEDFFSDAASFDMLKVKPPVLGGILVKQIFQTNCILYA